MERRERETIVELTASALIWGGIIVVVCALLGGCEAGPDRVGISYGRAIGNSRVDGIAAEAHSESDAGWLFAEWFLKPTEFILVDHSLRYPVPVDTNAPPAPVVITHGDEAAAPSLAEQAGDFIEDVDKAGANTLIFIMAVLALLVGLGALGGAVYMFSKQRASRSQLADGGSVGTGPAPTSR